MSSIPMSFNADVWADRPTNAPGVASLIASVPEAPTGPARSKLSQS